jgi:hypothetical protein
MATYQISLRVFKCFTVLYVEEVDTYFFGKKGRYLIEVLDAHLFSVEDKLDNIDVQVINACSMDMNLLTR